ncbi:hypothetical protein [uncultured Thiodictyon sp.]|uniref:hypothetical protein n=1 Tax=uncultured Thiodictyon sp. TaxID=1846217 RepID=UPI0025DDBDAB|nr:hypothetical protein [uncultured Thiodictyon sp.]
MIKAALFAVSLALTGVLLMQWRDWPRPLSPVVPPGAAQGAAAGADPTAGLPTAPALPESKEAYAGIAERPLFRPQRKPAPPPSAEPPPATVETGSLDGLDLTAVLISPEVTSAWIKDPSDPALKRLRLGDEQAGWSVKAILADRLVFERQGETHELLLLNFAAGQPAPPGAAPPGPPPATAHPTSPTRPGIPVRPGVPVRPVPGALRPPGIAGRGPQRTPMPGANPPGAPPSSLLPQPRPNAPRPP